MLAQDTRSGNGTTAEIAVRFRELGISFMPVEGPSKKPNTKRLRYGQWEHLMSRVPTHEEAMAWFGDDDPTVGIAAITGQISGGLVIRDFDNEVSYDAWRTAHPELASTCPTEKSPHGHHVYVRVPGVEIRTHHVKAGGPDDDGEIRGEGAYTVCSPTVGEGGEVYEWLIPLDVGIPVVDIEASGLALRWDGLESASAPSPPLTALGSDTQEVSSYESCVSPSCVSPIAPSCVSLVSEGAALADAEAVIRVALRSTIPAIEGVRHQKIFEFIRILKASPALASRPATELEPIFDRWYEQAFPFIRTKDRMISWSDFQSGWNRAYSAAFDNPRVAMEIARSTPLPSCAAHYGDSKMRELVGLCSAMQAFHGNKPFFLGCRTAGELVGLPFKTANRYMLKLQRDGLLIAAVKHDRAARSATGKRMAYEYRFVGDSGAIGRDSNGTEVQLAA